MVVLWAAILVFHTVILPVLARSEKHGRKQRVGGQGLQALRSPDRGRAFLLLKRRNVGLRHTLPEKRGVPLLKLRIGKSKRDPVGFSGIKQTADG